MKKETLTVETDEEGTVTFRNADGQRHNANGPAIISANGDKAHYINGELHNPNGPAVVFVTGYKEHWINGNMLSEAEFKAWQAEQAAK